MRLELSFYVEKDLHQIKGCVIQAKKTSLSQGIMRYNFLKNKFSVQFSSSVTALKWHHVS